MLIVVLASLIIIQTFLRNRTVTTPVDTADASQINYGEYAYPRGNNPPFGWIGCGYSFPNGFSDPTRCIEDGYTLINDGYANMSPSNFAQQFATLQGKNRLRQFMPYLGWGPYKKDVGATDVAPFPIDDATKSQAWWDARLANIRTEIAKNGNPDELFAFYTSDEPIVVDELRYQYNAIRKHFPKAAVFTYGTTYGGPWSVLKERLTYNDPSKLTTSFGVNGMRTMPFADIAGVAMYYTYSKIRYPEIISHGAIYYRVQALIDGICTQFGSCRGQQNDAWSWKKQGKTVYFVPELYADACIVSSRDPDRSSEKLVYDKVVNEITQSIAAGAQGVFAFEYNRFRQGIQSMECYYAMKDYFGLYQQIWPWIRAGNITRRPVTVTSGLANWKSPDTWRFEPNHPTLISAEFDLSGRKMIVVANLMSPSDFSGQINGTVNGLTNGTYDRLSLDQTTNSIQRNRVSISGSSVSVSLPPYGYAIYQQVTGDTTVSLTASARPNLILLPTPSTRPTLIPLSGGSVVVRARGTGARNSIGVVEYPRIGVTINGGPMQERMTSEEYQDFVFQANSVAEVVVRYLNDYEPDPDNDRNAQIDYVMVNGVVYQSESPTVESEGSWTNETQCSRGFKQREWIDCPGYLRFQITPSPSPIVTTSTPTPSPTAVSQSLTIEAENFVSTGGKVVVSAQETKPGVLIRDGYIYRFDPEDFVTYHLGAGRSLSDYSSITLLMKPRNTGGRIELRNGRNGGVLFGTFNGFSNAGLTQTAWQAQTIGLNPPSLIPTVPDPSVYEYLTLRALDMYEVGYIEKIVLRR